MIPTQRRNEEEEEEEEEDAMSKRGAESMDPLLTRAPPWLRLAHYLSQSLKASENVMLVLLLPLLLLLIILEYEDELTQRKDAITPSLRQETLEYHMRTLPSLLGWKLS
mgnify:CR=1 FL=1